MKLSEIIALGQMVAQTREEIHKLDDKEYWAVVDDLMNLWDLLPFDCSNWDLLWQAYLEEVEK